LIKHRDDWAGDLDIAEFAPHSVKTPGADLADILAADNPNIWHSHAPAKGGDTGAMFRRIIERALEIKAGNEGSKVTKAQAAAPPQPSATTRSRSTKAKKTASSTRKTAAKTRLPQKTKRAKS
jgi:hypothetical protein